MRSLIRMCCGTAELPRECFCFSTLRTGQLLPRKASRALFCVSEPRTAGSVIWLASAEPLSTSFDFEPSLLLPLKFDLHLGFMDMHHAFLSLTQAPSREGERGKRKPERQESATALRKTSTCVKTNKKTRARKHKRQSRRFFSHLSIG